jgi:hypothetical protein
VKAGARSPSCSVATAVEDVFGFADFFSVFADAFARDLAGVFREAGALLLESVFDADFFGDFGAMRLPFVAFRRSKEILL